MNFTETYIILISSKIYYNYKIKNNYKDNKDVHLKYYIKIRNFLKIF